MKWFGKLCCASALACGLLSLPPLRAMAADPTESLVVVYAFDAEKNIIKNEIGLEATTGYLATDDSTQVVIASNTAIVDGAEYYGVVSIVGEKAAVIEPMSDGGSMAFAMFELKTELDGCPAIPISADSVAQGQNLYVIGLDFSKQANDLKGLVTIGKTSMAGTVSDGEGHTFIQLEHTFSEGFVGGPVVDESGTALGVFNHLGDMNLCTSFQLMVGGSDVGSQGEGGGTESQSGPTEADPEGGGGQGAENRPEMEDGQGTGKSQGSGSMSYDEALFYGMPPAAVSAFKFLRMLLFPITILLIVVGCLYVKEELTRKDRGPAQFAETVRRVVSDGMSLMGTRGVFANKVFVLNKPLTIGRDASRCQVVYPQGTGGISSLHCQVTAQENDVAVMDLGSTYGTFLKDGTRLKPNVPYTLHRGDEFYLAEASNSYRVI